MSDKFQDYLNNQLADTMRKFAEHVEEVETTCPECHHEWIDLLMVSPARKHAKELLETCKRLADDLAFVRSQLYGEKMVDCNSLILARALIAKIEEANK